MGNPTNIIYRSLWERRFMVFCDTNKSVVSWGSEEVVIPYRSPIDGRMHRYYIDFVVRYKNSRGFSETRIIEVKPKKQCVPPEKPQKITKSFLNEMKRYGINNAKWKAAKEFAENRGWKFQILTEKELFTGE